MEIYFKTKYQIREFSGGRNVRCSFQKPYFRKGCINFFLWILYNYIFLFYFVISKPSRDTEFAAGARGEGITSLTTFILKCLSFFFLCTGRKSSKSQSPEGREDADHSRGEYTVGPKASANTGRGEEPRACTSKGQEKVSWEEKGIKKSKRGIMQGRIVGGVILENGNKMYTNSEMRVLA